MNFQIPRTYGRGWSRIVLLVVAGLSLAGAEASRAADFTVTVDPASPNDHTARIQAALNNASYSRIILPYRSAGWITRPLFMNVANQELWIAGSGSTPGKLNAKFGYPAYSGTGDAMIKVQATGCKINGYANGLNKTNGIATMEMYKSSYIPANGYALSESRITLRSSYNNTTIQGLILKNSGGDGIYINGGSGSIIKDVTSDGSNRNGISIIKADSLTISDSTFKNTSGATTGAGNGPWAGIDFEPNLATDNLTNIQLNNCVFSYNAGDNIMFSLENLGGTGVGSTLSVSFYNCTSDHAGSRGILLSGMRSDGPTLGSVYFQDSTISHAYSAGIMIRQWMADHTKAIFNDFEMTHCADTRTTSPIYFEDSSGSTGDILGDFYFQNNCYVDDYGSSHANIVRGTAHNGTNWKDIQGVIKYRRNYTVSTPVIAWPGAGSLTNVTISGTPY
jgi:hypothetical protein